MACPVADSEDHFLLLYYIVHSARGMKGSTCTAVPCRGARRSARNIAVTSVNGHAIPDGSVTKRRVCPWVYVTLHVHAVGRRSENSGQFLQFTNYRLIMVEVIFREKSAHFAMDLVDSETNYELYTWRTMLDKASS